MKLCPHLRTSRGTLRGLFFAAALTIALAASLHAQNLDYTKANYTKYEYYVPMRDGVRLLTAVYVPKDSAKLYPIMLNRTPYSIAPYGSDRYRDTIGPSFVFEKEGFIFAYQDVRGRWMSEGAFDHMRAHKPVKSGPEDFDESTDTFDTIAWLLKNIPNNNGRVGIWGISYPGFYAAMGLIDSHPALKAVSPQAPVADWFSSDDWHHNGAFLLAHAFGWFSRAGWEFTKPTTVFPGPNVERQPNDGYEFYLRLGPLRNANQRYMHNQMSFWDAIMEHDSKDAFWNARNILPHLKNVKPAVMTVGGWYDAENLYGALKVYETVERTSPGTFNILVMGPWVHGGWASTDGSSLGDVRFDAKTAEFYRENIELPFFNRFLKNKGGESLPEAYVFETGTNVWRRFDAWPPKQLTARNIYLRADGQLSFAPPKENAQENSRQKVDAGFDEYVSDPKKPVPLMTGIASGMARPYMTEDQRSAGRRPDVLVYTSDPLEDDLTLAGPIRPSLFVSTTGTDSDWVVKLIDVYPDFYPTATAPAENDDKLGGYWQLVRGDILRGKFRNSLEKPEAFIPGHPTKVEFVAQDIFHTFRRGHRVMVQIQSTWFPFADINPGRFMNIFQATEADFQKTTQRVYHNASMPSQIQVGVVAKTP